MKVLWSLAFVVAVLGVLYGAYVLLQRELANESLPPHVVLANAQAQSVRAKRKKKSSAKPSKAAAPPRPAADDEDEDEPAVEQVDAIDAVFGHHMEPKVVDLSKPEDSEWSTVPTRDATTKVRVKKREVAVQKTKQEEEEEAARRRTEKNRRRRQAKRENELLAREVERMS